MKKSSAIVLIFCVLVCVVLLSACAPNGILPNCVTGHKFGFWGGLWHGFIAPFDLIAMLFRDDVTFFAQNNNGAWYAFGFLLGSGGWGFFGGHGAKRRRRS
jgi:hypothetical protein